MLINLGTFRIELTKYYLITLLENIQLINIFYYNKLSERLT